MRAHKSADPKKKLRALAECAAYLLMQPLAARETKDADTAHAHLTEVGIVVNAEASGAKFHQTLLDTLEVEVAGWGTNGQKLIVDVWHPKL